MTENKIRTLDLLLEFGFMPAKNDHGFPCVVLCLGDFKLSAIEGMTLSCFEYVTLGGFWSTGRKCGEIDYAMPPEMTSREECAAWLFYALQGGPARLLANNLFCMEWLELGKNNEHKLPWFRDTRVYDARPQCSVERSWLRLALQTLAESLREVQDDELVNFSFQNQILLFRCGGQVIPLPGSGKSWTEDIFIKAADLRTLPARLRNYSECIDVWEGYLRIGNRGYPIYKTLTVEPTNNLQQDLFKE